MDQKKNTSQDNIVKDSNQFISDLQIEPNQQVNQEAITPVVPPLGKEPREMTDIFNPPELDNSKSKNNKVCFYFCCGIFVIMIFTFIILAILLLFTDIDIPVLSNLLSR